MKTSKVLTNGNPSLFLYDQKLYARRHLVIKDAAQEVLGTEVDVKRISTESSLVSHWIDGSSGSIIFIVITENQLADLKENRLPRVCCDSIRIGYDLIDKVGTNNDIYFVVRDVTGADVVSMLLSGARGVIDPDFLGSSEVIKKVLDEVRTRDRRLNRLLIGRPSQTLKSLREMVVSKWQLASTHWELLLALGEIPCIRLHVNKNMPNQKGIANEIANWHRVTGYLVNTNTSKKIPTIMELVASEVLEDDETDDWTIEERQNKRRQLSGSEMLELPYLPMYARYLGFPSRLLPISGYDQSQIAIKLYSGLRGIEFVTTKYHENGDVVISNITMPRNI